VNTVERWRKNGKLTEGLQLHILSNRPIQVALLRDPDQYQVRDAYRYTNPQYAKRPASNIRKSLGRVRYVKPPYRFISVLTLG
jgi:hypothetical protein